MGKDLRIIYTDGQHDSVDDAIIQAIEKLGFELWATGYNLKTKERDLVFEEKTTNDNARQV